MEFKKPYKSLNHALKYLKVQVIESLPYAYNKCPKLKTPEEIFNYLKQRTCYKHDPKGIELFQTLPTLMEKNFHGTSGAGDCDCFTIATLALLIANGFDKCGIVLVGRNPNTPVHIYAYVDYKGERKYLDLTNKYYNFERSYPYKQSIPLVLTQNDKNKMYLQLAEKNRGGNKQMLYLPNSRAFVPEAHLDSYHVNDFSRLLGDNGFTLEEINELSAKREKRKKDGGANRHTRKKSEKEKNKNAKHAEKIEKKKAKTDKIKSKSELKRAKAQKKLLVGQSKVDKANNADGEDNVSKFTRIFDSAGNAVANVRNKFGGGNSGGDDTGNSGGDDTNVPSGQTGKVDKTKKKKDGEESEGIFSGSFDVFGTEIPKPVAYLGGLALLYGGYKLATHKRK